MLTSRELEVVKLLCKGYTYQQIADDLVVSTHTAKAHTCSIFRKLGISNRAAVVLYAVKYNYIDTKTIDEILSEIVPNCH